MIRIILVLGLLLSASQAFAANRYVCAAGANCDSGSTHGAGTSYSTINAAIDASGTGDTIFIRAGEEFVENVNLDAKGPLASRIVLRSDAADTCFPASGVRLVPTTRADGVSVVGNTNPSCLPTIRSVGGGDSAITTSDGAQDYTLQFLRFTGNVQGLVAIIQLGKQAGQEFVSQQPQDITIDRVLFEANPFVGQKQGVTLNGKNLSVINSYFTNMVGYFQDAMCINGTNGEGPILIENNYGECAGYAVIFGGDDAQLRTNVSTTTGSTTTVLVYDPTSFRAGHTETAHVYGAAATLIGKTPAVQVSSSTAVQREWPVVTAVDTTANTITVTPALSGAPAAGLDIRWGPVYDGVQILRNHFVKPLHWQQPIVASPTAVQATPSNAAGSLTAATYYYVITAMRAGSYGNNTLHSAPSSEVSCTLDATGQCVLTWTAVTEATGYRIDGRASGTSSMYWTVSAPTVTYTDTGSAGTTGTRADLSGTATTANPRIGFWTIKTHIEFKQSNNVLIEGNILDNAWFNAAGGTFSGTPFWIKSTNQGGATEHFQTKGVIIRYNVARNVGGCFLFVSQEETTTGIEGRPNYLEDVEVHDNLCYLSGGANSATNQGAVSAGYVGPKNFSFHHNTLIHTKHSAWQFQSTSQPWAGTRSIRDNIFLHNTYGFMSDTTGFGAGTVTAHIGDANFLNNVLTSSAYAGFPATTLRPALAELQAAFVNYGGSAIGDYAIVANHPYLTASSTGGPVGANIATILTEIAGVIEGTVPNAPVITTASLLGGTENVAYTQTLAATGGTGAITWTVASGTLPTGVTLAGAILSGTPTVDGTYNFVIRATDTFPLFSERSFSIVIAEAEAEVTITTTTLPNAQVGTVYTQTLAATGGNGVFAWSVSTGALPAGLSINATTGVLSGTPSQAGSPVFTVRVASGASVDTQVFVLTVGNVGPVGPVIVGRPERINGDDLFTFKTCEDLDPNADHLFDRVVPGDMCLDDTTRHPFLVTATTPDVTVKGIGAHLVLPFYSSPTGVNVSNAAVAGTEFGTNMRQRVDLSNGYSQCRVHTYVANIGATGGTSRMQYSLDNSAWSALDDDVGPAASNASTGYQTSAYVTLAAAAKTDVWLRLLVFGDADADPGFRLVSLECR